ncbi:MAG: hypothetical protein C4528_07390 [Gammaproteobacteria bacterium]|nr:MAG: hypothetical protein C4528_07390 [Gammaproteobacteria bacterium]
MQKTRQVSKAKSQTNRLEQKLKSFGKKWEKVMAASVTNAVTHMKLAQELYDLALKTEGAELKIVEHRLDKPKAKPTITRYKLTNPRAALHTMLRFCNVWIPMGQWVCLNRGCPAWNPPGAPAGKFCFLIGCLINICPTPGAAKTRCVYLCI